MEGILIDGENQSSLKQTLAFEKRNISVDVSTNAQHMFDMFKLLLKCFTKYTQEQYKTLQVEW